MPPLRGRPLRISDVTRTNVAFRKVYQAGRTTSNVRLCPTLAPATIGQIGLDAYSVIQERALTESWDRRDAWNVRVNQHQGRPFESPVTGCSVEAKRA